METWKKLVALGAVTGNMPAGKWKLSEAFLSKAKLGRSHLSRANLSKANLHCAVLREAKLRECNLSEADLREADLRRADIRSADLSKANLTQADLVEANLDRADLRQANCSGAFLSRGFLNKTNLRNADLRGANLLKASLIGSDLRGANLSGAFLEGAFLDGANLSDADMSGAFLSGASFFGAKLHNSCLAVSRIVNVTFNNADLSGADITGAILWGLSNAGWNIDGIKATHVYFTRDIVNKEQYKRVFKKGQFEALFKSMPTIELIFDGGLSIPELWTLNVIIEDIKNHSPEMGLKLTNTSVNDFQAIVGIKTKKDAYLEKAAFLILDRLEKDYSIETLLPYFTKILPFSEMEPAILEPYVKPLTINQNITINLIKGDGSIIQSSPHAAIKCGDVINNYHKNQVEIETLFNELKFSLRELSDSNKTAMHECVEQLIEVLKEGKDIDQTQKIWNEIKEGLKTAGAAAGIVSALTKLLGM